MSIVIVNTNRRGMIHRTDCTYVRGANLNRPLTPNYVFTSNPPTGKALCSCCHK